MSPLVARLLEERGVSDVESFLNPAYDARPDPFLLKDMDKAVARILSAIEKKEKIAVWHDYDCDGIPGGSLLSDFFMKIEYPVRMHVAERSEGYGLNNAGIEMLASENVKVLITVDCGITDVEETKLAQSLGIDVIVTDHHLPLMASLASEHAAEKSSDLPSRKNSRARLFPQRTQPPGQILPPAFAVINAHRADDEYPFKGLCGTGVAFKLVEGLIRANGSMKVFVPLPIGWEKWLLDLVALATVADMVPLLDENRTLVKYGLHVMGKGRRKGLAALLRKEKIPLQFITEDDLGFSVAPKINAASRMESPRLAVELLTTTDDMRADELANKLVSLNKARKLEGARVAKEVKHRIDMMTTLGDIIVMGNSEWRPSLLGLAANNIVESYQKTVCLWGRDGDLIKGSIRSNGRVNVVSLMTHARGAFVDFGGHESSGGFSITQNAIHTLPTVLEDSLRAIGLSGDEPVARSHDGLLNLSDVSNRTYDDLRQMAPFGMNNRKPVFRFDSVRVERVLFFGGGKEHARLTLSDLGGHSCSAIAFFIGRSGFKDDLELLSPGDHITIDGCIERSHFAGRTELRIRIEGVRRSVTVLTSAYDRRT